MATQGKNYVPPHRRPGYTSTMNDGDSFEAYQQTHRGSNRGPREPNFDHFDNNHGRNINYNNNRYDNNRNYNNNNYQNNNGYPNNGYPNQGYNNNNNGYQNQMEPPRYGGYGGGDRQGDGGYGNYGGYSGGHNGGRGGGRSGGYGNFGGRDSRDNHNTHDRFGRNGNRFNSNNNQMRGSRGGRGGYRGGGRGNNRGGGRGHRGNNRRDRINFGSINNNYHLKSFSIFKEMKTKKPNLLVIGISGPSHSGKSTFTDNLYRYLIYSQNKWNREAMRLNEMSNNHNNNNVEDTSNSNNDTNETNESKRKDIKNVRFEISIYRQDDFFDKDLIYNELDRNFDDDRSVDHKKFYNSICSGLQNVIETSNNKELYHIWICEGYRLFYENRIKDMCDIKFWLNINKDECLKRCYQNTRNIEKQKEYFESKQWPGHLKYKENLLKSNPNIFNQFIILDSIKDNPITMLQIGLKSILQKANQWIEIKQLNETNENNTNNNENNNVMNNIENENNENNVDNINASINDDNKNNDDNVEHDDNINNNINLNNDTQLSTDVNENNENTDSNGHGNEENNENNENNENTIDTNVNEANNDTNNDGNDDNNESEDETQDID